MACMCCILIIANACCSCAYSVSFQFFPSIFYYVWLFYFSVHDIDLLHYSCQVWASKWNERAYFSARKVKLDHDYLCMAVLVQEVINADYAFVIHTTNPSSGDSSEIYAEVLYIWYTVCFFLVEIQSQYSWKKQKALIDRSFLT